MSGFLSKTGYEFFRPKSRFFSTSRILQKKHECKVLVVGGGAGGCTMASKMARRLSKGAVIVLDPAENHYYQPYYTLVGAGIRKLSDCRRSEKDVLPSRAVWLRDSAERFDPEKMLVTTSCGDDISYEYLVVAVGLQFNYDKVPGLKEALDRPDSRVSTIYSPQYVEKSWSDLQAVKSGELVFTYPAGPVKCPGAPQKICYLADSHHRRIKNRSNVNITYNSALGVIFGVKKYADALWGVVKDRGISVNLQTVLTAVNADKKEAVFSSLGEKGKSMTMRYDLLHAVPPMCPPPCLSSAPGLADSAGFLDVDKATLRHAKYANVFGIGDCTNTPNSKTAAAVAKQSYVVEQGLLRAMCLGGGEATYDGYGACPLVTSHNSAIMAEFDYNLKPKETLPINQAKERRIHYYMKRDLFPFLYWNLMLKGHWHGPTTVRKIINPLAE